MKKYGWQIEYPVDTLERGENQPAGTDLYIQTINQYYLWNVKERYRVPYASSGKCWRKYVERMANMW